MRWQETIRPNPERALGKRPVFTQVETELAAPAFGAASLFSVEGRAPRVPDSSGTRVTRPSTSKKFAEVLTLPTFAPC